MVSCLGKKTKKERLNKLVLLSLKKRRPTEHLKIIIYICYLKRGKERLIFFICSGYKVMGLNYDTEDYVNILRKSY